jgi:hypothetical protein
VRNRFAPLMSGLLVLVSTAAAAQVGFVPTRSPYLDLEHSQELTLIVGQYHGHRDPADVAPSGGFLVGAHYEWRAGGPAHLTGEVTRASSDSRILNPFLSGAPRDLGRISRPLYSATVGLGLSLTGAKSWHHIVPELSSGLGFISDFRSQADTGGFKFGTRFALNWGGGIRWVPGGSWAVRGDITNKLYTISYPVAFFMPPNGGPAVVSSTQARSFWTNNPAFTLGLSRLF